MGLIATRRRGVIRAAAAATASVLLGLMPVGIATAHADAATAHVDAATAHADAATAHADRGGGVLVQSLETFDAPLLFGYGSWEKALDVRGGALRLSTPDGRGGGGQNILPPVDLRARAGLSPAVRLTLNEAHRGKRLRVMLRDDQEGSATWSFDLTSAPRGSSVLLTPLDGASLATPNDAGEKPIDLSRVQQVQVQGDWSGDAFDLVIEEVGLVEPSAEMVQLRAKKLAEVTATAEAAAARKKAAREGIRHLETSPAVIHVGLVDRDILGITIADGVLVPGKRQPYIEQPGDQIVYGEQEELVDIDGHIRRERGERLLKRQGKDVGYIAGGRDGTLHLWPFESRSGDLLEVLTVDDVESYRVRSSDDPNYAEPKSPAAVHRKTKPTNRVYPTDQQTLRHTVYLKLPTPPVAGKTYTIEFPGVNVSKPSVEFTFDPKTVRSEAIHTQQVGYRPDDPFKRAFVSIWLGSGGGHTFAGLESFQLLDAAGKAVHQGRIEKVLAVDGTERVRGGANLSQTAVYAMDFSDFDRPGEYRVHVPGLGVSHPLVIGDDVWAGAFEKSMHGFLAQRSGIALGPPVTDFVRPRPMHPADGVRVFRTTTRMDQAYDGGDWFKGLIAGRTEQLMPDAWGGYHDAGDFDRASNHMWASYKHLELLDLFPDYFERQKLKLPGTESSDTLPDLLNEALWNIDCWRRLQDADGGVSGGIESSAHPRPGETSDIDSLVLMAYAPDAGSTYLYAALAARTARVAEKYDRALASTYRESALRAWAWAEQHRGQSSGNGYQATSLDDVHNTAAVELLALTGEARFDLAFQQSTKLQGEEFLIEQQGAAFLYARLPAGVGQEELKAKAKERLLNQADAALAYGDGNAFGLTVEIKDMPLIGPVGAFTTPGMLSQILPRAHYLSGDDKYLAGAVRACNFSLGANPDNMTMTTGVGIESPQAPLHMDSRYSGQPAPAGLTMYGAYDTASLPDFAQASDWVHTWHIGRTTVPNSRTWPAAEGYVDFFLWPMMNEFTIKQTMGPTSYFWGYLAARPAR